MDLKVGDRVTLKTSAIPMTIEKIEGDDVTCVWLNAKGKSEQVHLGLVSLNRSLASVRYKFDSDQWQ